MTKSLVSLASMHALSTLRVICSSDIERSQTEREGDDSIPGTFGKATVQLRLIKNVGNQWTFVWIPPFSSIAGQYRPENGCDAAKGPRNAFVNIALMRGPKWQVRSKLPIVSFIIAAITSLMSFSRISMIAWREYTAERIIRFRL